MRFSDLCKNKKTVNMAFIGGSITEGDSYRCHIRDYLKANYPDNEFNEIRAGVSGTPSFLGVHRMDRDVISHDPDMVFIEFSVNDNSGDKELYCRSMEGMVRKVLNHNPNALIAFIGTAVVWYFDEFYSKGREPEIVMAHKEIAAYYNIPYINVGKALFDYLQRSGEPTEKFLPDTVHPNVEGGKVYADEITNYLVNYEWNIDFKSELKTVNSLEKATLVMADKYVGENWKVSEDSMMGKNPNYIYSDVVDATLELDFYGSDLGLYCTYDHDSGDIDYSIDGGEWQRVSLWDTFCLQFDRAGWSLLAKDLEKKDHHVVMKISENKNEQSKGHSVKIGAFLVSEK